MKKIFLAISLITCVITSQAQTNDSTVKQITDGPVMEFESSVIDYGIIEHNADGKENLFLLIQEMPL